MSSRPAAGGGRWVEVDPARVARWVEGFAERHGPPTTTTIEAYGLLLAAPDGATAELHTPPGAPAAADVPGFVAAAAAPRRLGLLLARKGAVAVGVAAGEELVVSKVDTRYVQGRTAAGGWSQQRFARRRDNQAKAALADAVELAGRLLLPAAATLSALVCGGDRRAVDIVLSERRLAPLAALRAERLLDVPEPRHAVLVGAVAAARAVHILIRDPEPVGG
ncbi:acVLRF1 family peptidyl-tRNA hydrolase [Micromonospora sp. NBC_00898]|uniref:acVLRF1 family peptidyl-tRNA hydrolase n=1 Tax=Micromonospora sp. NBC_00898 TaxID=2975981 RepID=UPI0038672BC5|nr:acVLRF1 family peptidyl-tRNA hydrolase [Micromonospora sp. NBC_00898]